MASTLADLAVSSSDEYEKGVIERFKLTSDFIRLCPQKPIKGRDYRYRVGETLPGVAWRDVNEGYTESTGVIAPRIEQTMILGGDVFTDNALLAAQKRGADAYDLKAEQYDMKATSLARELERAFFEGDDLVNPKEMPGLRRRLTGNQVIPVSAAGGPLTLTLLDQLIDAIDPAMGKIHLWMNAWLRRKIMALLFAQTGSMSVVYNSLDETGRVITQYGGAEIHVVQDGWDASTLLAFDEDPGDGTPDTASIYATVFDERVGVCGLITGGDGDPLVSVREVGETTAGAPGIIGRIECYPGLMIKSPRAAARLRAITQL
jgi:hypothetical protein